MASTSGAAVSGYGKKISKAHVKEDKKMLKARIKLEKRQVKVDTKHAADHNRSKVKSKATIKKLQKQVGVKGKKTGIRR